MSNKFSQGGSTQTKPAVCHTWPYPPVPFVPPAYPDIDGYCDFQHRRPDHTYLTTCLALHLPWHPSLNRWSTTETRSQFTIFVRIDPVPPPTKIRILTILAVLGSPQEYHTWYAPPYTPHKPWRSGENILYPFPQPQWDWQTFRT